MTPTPIQEVLAKLERDAREQKRRVAQRLVALRGNHISPPSRGPIQANGRTCIRWHFWQAARSKHARITQRLSSIHALLGNPSQPADARP